MEWFVRATFAGSNQITLMIPFAPRKASSVKRGRVDVVQIWNVNTPLSVALTTVQMDYQTWTAVQVKKRENL